MEVTLVTNTDIRKLCDTYDICLRVTIYEEGKSWPCFKEDNPYLIEEEGVKEERGRKEEGRRRKEGGKEERRRKGERRRRKGILNSNLILFP